MGYEVLLVSQFTLYANTSHGNRPDFLEAAKPAYAEELYEYIIKECKNRNINVQTGIFGADMKVHLLNEVVTVKSSVELFTTYTVFCISILFSPAVVEVYKNLSLPSVLASIVYI